MAGHLERSAVLRNQRRPVRVKGCKGRCNRSGFRRRFPAKGIESTQFGVHRIGREAAFQETIPRQGD